MGQEPRAAQTEMARRSGMWVVRGSTERKRYSRRSLDTCGDVEQMRGIGHVADDWLRMASVEREFCTCG